MCDVRQSLDIRGWQALPEKVFHDIIFSAKAEAREYLKIVEVGTAYGRSIICFANLFKMFGKENFVEMYAVDIWKSDHQWSEFIGNLYTYGVSHMIKPIRAPSSMAVNGFADESIDVIYIDADHKFNSVCQDVILWTPKLKSTGILFGDDWQMPSVRKAVEQTIGLDNVKVIGNTWIKRGNQFVD